MLTQPLDLSVQTLFEQWNDKILVLPDIQREYLWDNGRASRLIESLILNIPVPPLYFSETAEAKYEIIDGHQRVASITRYLHNQFGLSGLAILREYIGRRFHQLPEREQRFLRMRTLRTIIISIDSHPNMKFEIFERLNSGAILLNAQELRNSIYRGRFNSLLHQLVKTPTFRKLIDTAKPRRRMVDQELVLRFFAMYDGLGRYRTPLKRFLNEYMEHARQDDDDRIDALRTCFLTATSRIHRIMGAGAFRMTDLDGLPLESTVNRALFEAQMLACSWMVEREPFLKIRDAKREIGHLFADEAFLDSIQRATGDRARTLKRIRETVGALQRAGAIVEVPVNLSR